MAQVQSEIRYLTPPSVDEMCIRDRPTSLYFFKTAVEPHIGDVQYFKVMSGKVHEGEDFTNADRGSKERIAQIYACAGANRIKVEEMVAGRCV